jgi:hypothetical protein
LLSKWTESTGWKAVKKISAIKAGVGADVLLSSVVMLQLILYLLLYKVYRVLQNVVHRNKQKGYI